LTFNLPSLPGDRLFTVVEGWWLLHNRWQLPLVWKFYPGVETLPTQLLGRLPRLT
jgi:hypothetical protein